MSLLGTPTQPDNLDHRKQIAWENAYPALGHDPNHTRKDAFGWWIEWNAYGDRSSPWGWEIDHVRPTILGGSDHPSNLRALHWRNNATLGGLLSGSSR